MIWQGFVYLLLLAGSAVMLMPFLWMASTALKSPAETFRYPPVWVPETPVWENFGEALRLMRFPVLLRNTIEVTVYSLVGTMVTSTIVAYSFARLRFPGRSLLFLVLLSTMMLPGQVTLIPVYIIFKSLGWINTLYPLWVGTFFGGSPFYIFLLRQFFMTLPRELDEAAQMDGCSIPGVFWSILLPLCKPALATVAIFTFMSKWDDFMGPLIYINSMNKMTLALGLYIFQGATGVAATKWNYLMAGSLVVMMPCLLLFFVAQKYFIQGIVLTGMKG